MWAALVAALAYSVGRYPTENRLRPYLSQGAAELKVLEQRYGPSHDSQGGEEWIVRDFFGDQRNGVFVEVGANHPKKDSQSFHLEEAGWQGILVEPLPELASELRRVRRARVFEAEQTQVVFRVSGKL